MLDGFERFRDPNYISRCIAGGYELLPPRWKMQEQLAFVEFKAEALLLPNDARFDFLICRIGSRTYPILSSTGPQSANTCLTTGT
jgi:hypothetical protein